MVLEAFITVLSDHLMGKVIELASSRVNLSVQIHHMSFGQWSDGASAAAAVIEVTNLSEAPYTVSSFNIIVGDVAYQSRPLAGPPEFPSANANLMLATVNHFESVRFDDFQGDFSNPLGRPYLQRNASAIGLVVFKIPTLPHNVSAIGIEACIAGVAERPRTELHF